MGWTVGPETAGRLPGASANHSSPRHKVRAISTFMISLSPP